MKKQNLNILKSGTRYLTAGPTAGKSSLIGKVLMDTRTTVFDTDYPLTTRGMFREWLNVPHDRKHDHDKALGKFKDFGTAMLINYISEINFHFGGKSFNYLPILTNLWGPSFRAYDKEVNNISDGSLYVYRGDAELCAYLESERNKGKKKSNLVTRQVFQKWINDAEKYGPIVFEVLVDVKDYFLSDVFTLSTSNKWVAKNGVEFKRKEGFKNIFEVVSISEDRLDQESLTTFAKYSTWNEVAWKYAFNHLISHAGKFPPFSYENKKRYYDGIVNWMSGSDYFTIPSTNSKEQVRSESNELSKGGQNE